MLSLSILCSMWPVTTARASSTATFTVTTTADVVDTAPGNGICAASVFFGFACSLRAAVMEAKALGGAHTVVLQAGQTYTLTMDATAGDEDNAVEDDLDIAADITLVGNGATIRRSTACNLDGNVNAGEFRLFHVHSPAGRLVLQNVTLRDGCADDNTTGYGGGIRVEVNRVLILTQTTLQNNAARRDGGGIYNAQGRITLTDSSLLNNNTAQSGGGIAISSGGEASITRSTIANNTSSFGGGGIYNAGDLSIFKSTIRNNIAGSSLGFGGGAIFNSGSLNLSQSTLSGNAANGAGGGLVNSGEATLINSTFSGNTTASSGGGIYTFFAGSKLDLVSVTIASNTASSAGGGIGKFGTTVRAKNVIIGSNLAPANANCDGSLNVLGTNLATDASCAGFTAVPSSGSGGLNLGTLANNGGPTWTHALLANSAAINAVPAGQCTDLSLAVAPLDRDQRDMNRPMPAGARCDVGAYEVVHFTFLPSTVKP